MDNMDIPYESSELMSSEFFDSVFSLEQEGLIGGLDDGLAGNFDDDMFLSSETSSHADEINSTNSSSSNDCDKWSTTESIAASPASNVDVPDNDLFLSLIAAQNKVKVQPQPEQKPSKIIISNGSTKRVIIPKQHTIIKKAVKPKQQHIFRVQTENGRSLLLPLNIANVKSIKIVNNRFKEQNVTPLITQDVITLSPPKSSADEEEVEVSSEETHYPPLNLTTEEKRLLSKDGIQLPTHYPLTKNEERELKRIRRKIRNKISAQDSRKRKKEYVDGLEERVKRGSEENKFLLRRVKQLQKQNGRLMEQMSKLQALIFNSGSTKATPTTCLMIVLFSALLVSLPNLSISNNKEVGEQQQVASLRRSLLFSQQATNEDDTLNMEEFVRFGKKDESDIENSTDVGVDAIELEMAADKEASLIKLLQEIKKEYNIPADKINCFDQNSGFEKLTEYCNKYENDIHDVFSNIKHFFENEVKLFNEKEIVNSKIDYGGTLNEKGFIEPDIDDFVDDTPVSKKARLEVDNLNEVVVNSNTLAINSSKKE